MSHSLSYSSKLTNPSEMNSCDCCQHVGAINKSEVDKAGPSLLGTSAEFKENGSFCTVPASALALETTDLLPQYQLEEDNDSSGVRSYLEQVFIVKCTSCDKSVALLIDGKCQSVYEKLHNEEKADGWVQVDSEADRLVLFILSQLVHREYEAPDEDELQVEYALPHDSDIVKVLWINGNAVGFYSVKPKGTLDFDTMDSYSMTVLDTIFIRNSFRRKGYALSALTDIIQQYPNENIGLSVPISLPMIKVLKKHLDSKPADRMRLWEVTGCGSEGNCQIIWYILKNRQI